MADSGERKAKARCVILGYQDPQYELRAATSPTMSRTRRQIFLQRCTNQGFKVYKGDVSGAFLQGEPMERNAFCMPVKELCEALGAPEGAIFKLNKAAYGLVDAPLRWFLTIIDFLESLRFVRQTLDPCCDDFLFGGSESDGRWTKAIAEIQRRFKSGEWEHGCFTQCGVQVRHDGEGFALSQEHFLDDVTEINIPMSRYQEQENPHGQAAASNAQRAGMFVFVWLPDGLPPERAHRDPRLEGEQGRRSGLS